VVGFVLSLLSIALILGVKRLRIYLYHGQVASARHRGVGAPHRELEPKVVGIGFMLIDSME